MGPVEEWGTIMTRISTGAGVAASPESASLSVVHLPRAAAQQATVAPAELDAASTGLFDVLCTDMLVPMAPNDKLARHKSRGGTTHHVCRPRGSSPTSPARSVSPHT